MRVKCYLNLHKTRAVGHPVYSVVDAKTGRVIDHASEVNLVNVEFRVSEAGRQRVLREKAKNVHAYVVGTLAPRRVLVTRLATYNPYKYDSFVDRKTELPLTRAMTARLDAEGLHYASGDNPVSRALIQAALDSPVPDDIEDAVAPADK